MIFETGGNMLCQPHMTFYSAGGVRTGTEHAECITGSIALLATFVSVYVLYNYVYMIVGRCMGYEN